MSQTHAGTRAQTEVFYPAFCEAGQCPAKPTIRVRLDGTPWYVCQPHFEQTEELYSAGKHNIDWLRA